MIGMLIAENINKMLLKIKLYYATNKTSHSIPPFLKEPFHLFVPTKHWMESFHITTVWTAKFVKIHFILRPLSISFCALRVQILPPFHFPVASVHTRLRTPGCAARSMFPWLP
jgi:hypothetical protein